MFCRETCKVTIQRNSEKLGGEGKVVQIDESKVGKRKYHRGHRVEGQWVFGGIEDSRTFSGGSGRSEQGNIFAYHKRLDQTGNVNCLRLLEIIPQLGCAKNLIKLTARFSHNPKAITPKNLWVSLHPCLMKDNVEACAERIQLATRKE